MPILIRILFSLLIVVIQSCATSQLNNPRNVQYNWDTDTTKRIIDLSEITVVLPRNTFPTINYPMFINKKEGLKAFYRHEPVIAVEINKEAKAYPLSILTMHEISNDVVGGVPVLPTYCPLCNSSIVYNRILNHNGQKHLLNFEVSGMLRNSDMIMADKETQTWWQQLTGTGLVGAFANVQLKVVPSMVISVEEFFNSYPKGKILSPKTGTRAQDSYGINPYVGYDNLSGKPYDRYFDLDKLDSRLAPMERVVDIKGNNGHKIYPFTLIAESGVVNDIYDGDNIVLFYSDETVSVLDKRRIDASKAIGSVTVFSPLIGLKNLHFEKISSAFMDSQTKSTWDITGRCIKGELKGKQLKPKKHGNHFAFAWLAFYPDSEIYDK